MAAMLEVKNLGISFGGLRAVNAVDMVIEKGCLYGLIGPNGAGKTTFFNLITGVYKPNTGKWFWTAKILQQNLQLILIKRVLHVRSRIFVFSKECQFWIM